MNGFAALDGLFRNFSYGNETGTAVQPAFSCHEFFYLLKSPASIVEGLCALFLSSHSKAGETLTGMCQMDENFIMIHLKNWRFLSATEADPQYQHT